ncbi:SCO2322 family protein [Streptomyces johnsoniae]|uniref:SCO2322 family protein n=1 Tax=Streptomyces johnsoniae TaxID=3075532 RepID=A0ABU2SEE8_9ACTN|nr:SCO2322 family protein [Streptomyces sp. DSM 41886]MDT0447339.1 SCO2322 family protein [Streptomyces sp. DSM 41886]
MSRGAPRRRARAALLLFGSAALGGLLVPAGAAPAAADDDRYRYWSFWTWDSTEERWSYAVQGPGTLRPGDGDVLGFRFAESTGTADASAPRGAGDFAAACGPGDGGDGERVALVLDFGTARDAPGGTAPPERRAECAPLPDGGTAAEALAAVAEPLRYDANALLCAIAGYPARGCADEISDGAGDSADDEAGDEAQAGDADDDGGGSGVAVLAGVGVVAALGTAALLRARRRRA